MKALLQIQILRISILLVLFISLACVTKAQKPKTDIKNNGLFIASKLAGTEKDRQEVIKIITALRNYRKDSVMWGCSPNFIPYDSMPDYFLNVEVKEFLKNYNTHSRQFFINPQAEKIYQDLEKETIPKQTIQFAKHEIPKLPKEIDRIILQMELQWARGSDDFNSTLYDSLVVDANDKLNKIKDKYEGQKSFELLGDYMISKGLYDYALNFYLLSIELLESYFNENSKQNLEHQGDIYLKIANIYYDYYEPHYLSFSVRHYLLALKCFDKSNSQKYRETRLQLAESVMRGIVTNGFTNFTASLSPALHYDNITFLYEWLYDTKNKSPEELSEGFYDLGYLMLWDNENFQSRNFFLQSAYFALQTNDKKIIKKSFLALAHYYSHFGNKILSLKYLNIYETIVNNTMTFESNVYLQMDKIVLFNSLGMRDSSTRIANKVLADTNRYFRQNPITLIGLNTIAQYQLYINAAIKGLDTISSNIVNYFNLSNSQLTIFDLVKDIETNAFTNWKEREMTIRVDHEALLKEVEKKNFLLERYMHHKDHATDSIIQYADSQKIVLDSFVIRDKNDLLRHTNDSLRYTTDSFNQQKIITNQQSKIIKQDRILRFVGAFFAILIMGGIALYAANRKRNLDLINDMVVHNIHNVQSDLNTREYIRLANKKQLEAFTDQYDIYLDTFYTSWRSYQDNPTSTNLAQELELLKQYVQAFLIPYPGIDLQIEQPNFDIKKCLIPPSTLITLFNNSVKRGFKENPSGHIIFKIEFKQYLNWIECNVFDNGTPAENISKYLERKASGLNIIKRRLKKYWKGNNLFRSQSTLQISILPNKAGTQIKMKLPYV